MQANMMLSDPDPDVVRWNLDQLCLPSNGESPGSVTYYGRDCGQVGYVREGYQEPVYVNAENDAVIARAYQEELSRLAAVEASGDINPAQAYIVSQDWLGHLGRQQNFGYEYDDHTATEDPNQNEIYTSDHHQRTHEFSSVNNERASEDFVDPSFEENMFRVIDITDDESSVLNGERGKGLNQMVPAPVGTTLGNLTDDESSVLDGEVGKGLNQLAPVPVSTTPGNLTHDESSVLDGEVGKRLNQMVPVPHVPKTNGDMPSADEEISDHERLLERLNLYDLVENKVEGDGNCQFRALSDQLYRSPDHHKFVREQVVSQLESYPEMYKGYVPMAYGNYLKKMSKNGEWGDHVTLQAAADSYGVKIFVITSFKDTCYIEILPCIQKSHRVICLSFWAEVHYNSIYPEGELPISQGKRKKKWWQF